MKSTNYCLVMVLQVKNAGSTKSVPTGHGSTIKASYIVTNGEGGDGAANFVFSGKLTYRLGGGETDITSGVSLLTTVQASEKPVSEIEIPQIPSKLLAPRVYASQQRAVNSE